MNPRHRKYLVYAAVWAVSSAASFWIGTRQSSPPEKVAFSPSRNRSNTDRGTIITLQGSGDANGDKAARSFNLQDLLKTKGRIDADLLREWAASIDPSQFGDFLSALQQLPSGLQRDGLLGALVNSWATREPESYLKIHGGIGNPSVRENGVADALRALAEKDPKAALAWITDSTEAVPNNVANRRLRSAIEGFANNDPQEAVKYVANMGQTSLGDQQVKRQGLNTLADALANQGRFSDAVSMFNAMPDDARNTATARLMDRWAEASPAEASQFVATVTDPALRSVYASEVAATWARNDPQGAAAWAAQVDQSTLQSGGERPGAILADTVRSWSRYDLNGPAQFLNQLPPSPANDPAVVTFSVRASQVDAASAMNWTNAISDSAVRERAQGAIAARALAADPANFNQFLATATTLTDQQKQWLGSLPTDNPQQLARTARRLGENFISNPVRGVPWNPDFQPPPPPANPTQAPASIGGRLGTQGRGARGFGAGRG